MFLDIIFGEFMPHNHGAFMGWVVTHRYPDGILFEQSMVIDILGPELGETFVKRTVFYNN